MRAFIALELPVEFADDIAAMARVLSASVEGRFLSRDTYHVTLAFLGDIAEADITRAMDALDEACDRIDETSAVPLVPDGLGKFGRASDATLWLGLAKEAPLIALAERLRESLHIRGMNFDEKTFLPHVTLARRVHLPKRVLPQLAFPVPANATAITLFKSTLSREGAIYKSLYSRHLP